MIKNIITKTLIKNNGSKEYLIYAQDTKNRYFRYEYKTTSGFYRMSLGVPPDYQAVSEKYKSEQLELVRKAILVYNDDWKRHEDNQIISTSIEEIPV